jgi:phytol kinase
VDLAFAVVATLLWGGGVICVGVMLARSSTGRSLGLARKAVHAGIGAWAVPMLMLFQRDAALAMAIGGVAMNLADAKWRFLGGLDDSTGARRVGTVLHPLAFVLLFLSLWESPAAIAAGLWVMAFADPAAALAGRKWGTPGAGKTLAGSLAFAVVATVAMLAVACWIAPRVGGGAPALWALIPIAIGATLVERFSPGGSDNLTVPLAVSLAWWAIC